MSATPVQQSKALQPHVLTSPLPHHPIELGQAKNPNKNAVAERAVQELETEVLRQEPLGGAVSPLTLAVATSALNSRIRSRGLSSREMWTQRDQFSNQQLPLADDQLIALQHEQRLSNHPHRERSKGPLHKRRPTPLIDVGDLVYLHSDWNKSRARDRYLGRQSFQQTLTLLACGDHLAPDVVLRVLKIIILNYSLCY